MSKLKDLYKPGRKFNEYVNEDGTPRIDCISCGRRPSIGSNWGGWICGDNERFKRCNPNYPNYSKELDYSLWIPRVDYSVLDNGFIKKDDFNV